jgi:hypothetical protein
VNSLNSFWANLGIAKFSPAGWWGQVANIKVNSLNGFRDQLENRQALPG